MPRAFPLAVVAALVCAAPAWAGIGDGANETASPSTISFNAKGLHFIGVVTSIDQACVARRNVLLFRATKGKDQRVGATATKASGNWNVRLSGTAGATLGRYYAVVKATTAVGSAGTVACGAARSGTVSPSDTPPAGTAGIGY